MLLNSHTHSIDVVEYIPTDGSYKYHKSGFIDLRHCSSTHSHETSHHVENLLRIAEIGLGLCHKTASNT